MYIIYKIILSFYQTLFASKWTPWWTFKMFAIKRFSVKNFEMSVSTRLG